MVLVTRTIGDPTAEDNTASGANNGNPKSNDANNDKGDDDANNNYDRDDDAPLLPSHWSSFGDKKRKANVEGESWPDLGGGHGRRRRMMMLPPRILLLALYLMFTLSTFWILDSIKEPTLALLVHNNELGKHQPRAKMVSFVVVILLALVMEAIMRGGRRRRRRRRADRRRGQQQGLQLRLRQWAINAALEKSWEERNLPSCMRDNNDHFDGTELSSGGGDSRWRKMGTRTSRNFWNRWNRLRDWTSSAGGSSGGYHDFDDNMGDEEHEGDDEARASASPSSKISIVAFYVVGIIYIKAFVAVALALRQHPSFRSSSSSTENLHAGHADPTDEDSSLSSWYYTALGYVFFALVESYGSVSITLFWSFANSHLTLEAAEKHYGSTVALAQAGAIGGSTLVAILGRRTNTANDDIDDRGYGGPAAEAAADAFVGIAAHEGVAMERVVEAGNYVTPFLIFMACGCIGAGIVVMKLYSRLFATPMMQQQRPPPTMTTMTTAAHYDMNDDVQIEGGENDDSVVGVIETVDDADDHHRSQHSTTVAIQSPKLYCQDDENDVGGSGATATNINYEKNGIFTDLLGGAYMIYRHEYLQLVLAVSVLYEIALTCMHYEMNLLGLNRFGVGGTGVSGGIVDNDVGSDLVYERSRDGSSIHHNDEGVTYIQFMGWYGQTVNVLSLFLSFYAFPRLIKNYGLLITIRIFPTVLLLVTIFAFVLFPQNLYFLFVSLSICKALTYSIHDPAEEVLYMPTSDDAKFRAKFWIDVVGQRIAKALGSAINNYAGSVEEIVKYGSLPSIVSALALWLVCYQVGVQFESLIKSGEVVGSEEEDRRREREQGGLELCEGVPDSDADCEDGTRKFDCDESTVERTETSSGGRDI